MKRYIKEYVERIKELKISYMVFSFLFALMSILSKHTIVRESDRTTLEDVFFSDMGIIDIVLILAMGIGVYLIICLIPKMTKNMFFKGERKKNFLILLLLIGIIAIAWLPYIFSHWPGGVYSDTMYSLWMATGEEKFTSHEPFFYTLLWVAIMKITGGSIQPGEYSGLYTFSVMQYLAMAVLLGSFVYWLYKRGLKTLFIIIIEAVFSVFNLYPFYAVSLWKDTIFGIVIFLFSWFLFCVNEKIVKSQDLRISDYIKFFILCVCTTFFRNNGIYVVMFVCFVFMLSLWKKRELLIRFAVVSIASIGLCIVIQQPVFDALGYNVDTAIESMGIPIQQTAYIISTDGKMGDKEAEFMGYIMPLETWKSTYSPITVDYLKFDPEFDRVFFISHNKEFLINYAKLCLKNPTKAIKGYLLSNFGFWDLYKNSSVAYIGNESIAWTGIFQGDYFAYYTGFSFKEFAYPKRFISAALWIWILLLVLTFAINRNDRRCTISMLPALGVWATIMIAAPISYSFRYVFAVFLCVPIYLLCITTNEDSKDKI